MSFTPRKSLIGALVAGLAARGFLSSPTLLRTRAIDRLFDGSYARDTNIGAPGPYNGGRHRHKSGTVKHTSRAKSRKRARCKAKRRSHR